MIEKVDEDRLDHADIGIHAHAAVEYFRMNGAIVVLRSVVLRSVVLRSDLELLHHVLDQFRWSIPLSGKVA